MVTTARSDAFARETGSRLGAVSMWLLLAVLAGRSGAVARARLAIWLHGSALLFVLLVVMNGSTENIMTTRPATVKWLLLPVQVALAGGAVWGARRAVEPPGRSGSVAV